MILQCMKRQMGRIMNNILTRELYRETANSIVVGTQFLAKVCILGVEA